MDTVSVRLGGRAHPILIGPGLLDRVGRLMADRGLTGKAWVLTNPTVGALYADRLAKSLDRAGIRHARFDLPDGEAHKTLAWCARAYRAMVRAGLDRGGSVVALGGGVVGDVGGFLAATYLRGVAAVQVPTSLIAQVDSSVGGKTGVNLPEGKNLVGAFRQPDLVVIDPLALRSLPEREMASGMAEVVKYGVIAEESFFAFVEDRWEALRKLRPRALQTAIVTSCRIKAAVVEVDEREAGPRSILNFGHTFGHALETLTRYRRYTHGEAVAIGMAWAGRLSAEAGLCPREDSDRLTALLRRIGLPVEPPRLNRGRWLEVLGRDKKARGGRLRLVLMRGLGEVGVYEEVPEPLLFRTRRG
ncbi:MAG: 3-dehydroquinate synthase [Nitrospinota bacterium]